MSQNFRPTAVFALTHPWVRAVIQKMADDITPEVQVLFLDTANEQELAQILPYADFLVTLSVRPDWIPLLKRCQLVQANGVGTDAIDVAGLKAAGIPVAISPQGTAVGVAEHTVLFILALSKQLIPVHNSMQAGRFEMFGWRQNSYTFHGKTLGIVGLGRIGRQVAHLAHAFGANVIYNDLVQAPVELEERLRLRRVSFAETLAEADIVTVHVPLTALTQGMFGAAEFAAMKPGSLYVNLARGGTYVLDDLYDALQSGHIRGAGLDVFLPEPPPADHPILQLPNVLCTPHMASGTVDRHQAIARGQLENFQRVLAGDPPLDLV